MEPQNLSDITAFVTALRTGSFSSASESLGLTRSAVSKCVARVEARLGVRLLNRSTRSLSPTDEGKIAYERWSQILEDLNEVDAAMAMRRGKPTGVLRLTAPSSFGQRHILPLLEVFLAKWPELRGHLSFTDRYVDLLEDGFDIAIRIGGELDDSQLIGRVIAQQQFVICASPAYLKGHGVPKTPSDLSTHSAICFLTNGRPRLWRFDGPEGAQLIEPVARTELDSSEGMRVLALAGMGLVCLPTYVVSDDLKSKRLKEVLRDFRPAPDPIRVVYPSKRHLSPRIRAFIDHLVHEWGQCPPWHC